MVLFQIFMEMLQKPLVAIGGTDMSTGLTFQSKVGNTFIPVTLFSKSGADIISPATTLAYQLTLKDKPVDTSGLTLDYNNSELSLKLDNVAVTSSTHQVRVILYKGSTELSHSFAINKAMTKAESLTPSLASETSTLAQDTYDGLKFVVYDLSADVSVDNPKAKSVTLSSFDDGVNLATAKTLPR